MAVRVVIEGDAASVIAAFKAAGQAAGGFSDATGKATEKTSSFSGAMSHLASTAGGFLAANVIQNITGNIMGMGAAMFGAVAKQETMVNSIKNLVAVEKIRDSMQTKIIGTTTTVTTLTGEQRQKLDDLGGQYTKLNASIAVHTENLQKAIDSKKKSAAEIELMKVNLQGEREKLNDVSSAISALEGKEGQLITTTQTSRQATIDMATAKKMAAQEAEGLLKWIKQLAIASPFSQEDIAKGFKVAMGFNFTAQEAKALTQDLTDLSAGMGLEGTAIDSIMRQLGQAKGKGKLMSSDLMVISEAGGPVTEALLSIGKSLKDVENGEVSVGEFTDAFQKVIRQNFAGAAAASGDSLAGMMASLGDLKEEIMRTFATPVIEAFRGPLVGLVAMLQDPTVTATISGWGAAIGKFASDGIAGIGGLVTTITGLFTAFQSGGAGGLAKALGLSPEIVDIVTRIASSLGSLAGAAQALFKGDIAGAAADFSNAIFSIGKATDGLQTSLVEGIQAATPGIVAKLAELGQKFIDFVGPIIPPLLGELARLYIQMETWMISTVVSIDAQLLKWGQEFVDFIKPFVPPFLAAMQDLAEQFLNWIISQAGPILDKLGVWTQSFIASAKETIPKFLAEWPAMLDQFLSWIEVSAGPILQQLGTWATSFIVWIAPMIPPFIAAIAGLAAALLVWIAETAVVIAQHFIDKWAPAFMGWWEDTKRQALQAAMDFGVGIGEELHNQAVAMIDKAGEIGESIVSGIQAGITAKWGEFTSWIHDQIMKIPQAVRDLLDIRSPSKVFEEIGGQMAAGLMIGFANGMAGGLPGIAQLPMALQERTALDDFTKAFLEANAKRIEAENERHDAVMDNIKSEWDVIDGNYQQWKENDYQARYLEGQRHDARMKEIVGEGEWQDAARKLENQYHSDVLRDLDDIAKVKEYNYHNDSRNHNAAVSQENERHTTIMDNLSKEAEEAKKNHDAEVKRLDAEIAKWKEIRDAAIAARQAPGEFRGVASGSNYGTMGAGSVDLGRGAPIPGLAGFGAGINNLAAAFSPGAMGVGGRNDVQHQINVAEDQLKELQKISANLDQRDKENLRTNEKQQALLDKLNSGALTVGSPEFIAAITLSRSLVGNAGGVDDPQAAVKLLKEQAAQIKEDAIDRKIAEDAQKLVLDNQLDSLKSIKETNDAQLQYLMDIASNTAVLAGGAGRFTPPGNVVPAGYGSGFLSLPVVPDDSPTGMARRQPGGVTVAISNLNVTADSVAAGQAAGRAAAQELEVQLANAIRRRNIGL